MSSEAISRYNQAIQKNANHEKSIYELGILYMQKKKFELASIQFKKILILTPDDPMAAEFLHFCEQNL
jgi:tetratricopeptide (TPR) repeat protein